MRKGKQGKNGNGDEYYGFGSDNVDEFNQFLANSNISSIRHQHNEYFPESSVDQQMVLIPKYKLKQLFDQVKSLKKAIKSQKRLIGRQLQSLKESARQNNIQTFLRMRQAEYLKDIVRSQSEGKIKFYKTQPLQYQSKF